MITYSYTDANGCSASALSSIFVNSLPTVDVGPFADVCINTASFTLSSGTPSGGLYSGTGVNNDSLFSAAVANTGSHVISYTYTDANGCVNHDSSEIQVNALPVVIQSSFAAVCANTGPVALTGGSPSGGHYSGTAVSGTTFFTGIAGAGTHTITYTYTDANSCTNTATTPIQVNPVPQPNLGPDTTVCAETNVLLTAGNNFQAMFGLQVRIHPPLPSILQTTDLLLFRSFLLLPIHLHVLTGILFELRLHLVQELRMNLNG